VQLIYQRDIEEIVQGCVAGDRIAQHRLYKLYVEKMFVVCMRYGKDVSEAEDILQDGFIRVFRKIDTFKGTGSLEGWIRRVVVNTAIRHCQNKRRLYKVVYLDDMSQDVGEDLAECEFELDELLKMIQGLPEGYRAVFNMYVIDGYSHAEIAKQLEISEGTSKSQLSRARQHLKVLIHQHRKQLNKFNSEQSAG